MLADDGELPPLEEPARGVVVENETTDPAAEPERDRGDFDLIQRLGIYCQTTGVRAAHAAHCAAYCTPCRPRAAEPERDRGDFDLVPGSGFRVSGFGFRV